MKVIIYMDTNRAGKEPKQDSMPSFVVSVPDMVPHNENAIGDWVEKTFNMDVVAAWKIIHSEPKPNLINIYPITGDAYSIILPDSVDSHNCDAVENWLEENLEPIDTWAAVR